MLNNIIVHVHSYFVDTENVLSQLLYFLDVKKRRMAIGQAPKNMTLVFCYISNLPRRDLQ